MDILNRLSELTSIDSKYWILIFKTLIFWIVLNTVILQGDSAIDEYPFILLNLLLSCIAALQAPIIMMSQNRQAAKDSLRNQNDYRTDLKSELILEELHDKMELILKNQKKIMKELEEDTDEKDLYRFRHSRKLRLSKKILASG